MPLFGEDKIITADELALLVDWLRGEWFVPETVSAK